MITLDTSGFWAAVNTADNQHAAVRAALDDDLGPWYIPASILTEISWIIRARNRPGKTALATLQDFLSDLETGQYILDRGEQDASRIRELVTKYDDCGVDFADAAVVACAERHHGRVLTTDRRHFSLIARGETTLVILPE